MSEGVFQLLLMRHGAAEPNAIEDAARVLSLEGRAEVIHVGAALRRRPLLASAVVSSPYLRARQTTELLSEALDLPRLEDDERLIPAGDPEALALDLVAEARSLIAVLHLPLIAALVQTLTGEVVAAPTGALFAVEGSNQSDERPVLKWWL